MTITWCFAGWGQDPKSLQAVSPEGSVSIPYLMFDSYDALVKALDMFGDKPDAVIGWSLGGQIALRLIGDGYIRPDLQILLATPFQFVQGRQLNCGMSAHEFELFCQRFVHQPEQTLGRFQLLVARNDSDEKNIRNVLETINIKEGKLEAWLQELGDFTCSRVDFSVMPQTLLIHGRDDVVVDVSQTALFTPFFSGCEIEVYDQCGHAPHLHDVKKTQMLIQRCYDHALLIHS